jgi:small GTP-binding protein
MDNEIRVKIVVLGESTVGKTCLISRFVKNSFVLNHLSTIGVDVQKKEFDYPDGRKCTLQIWDTAGQEKFRSLSGHYLRNTDGVILLYDITNYDTFEKVANWIETINSSISECSTVFIGNKIDLEDNRMVSKVEGMNMADSFKSKFAEASAKSGEGIEECFKILIQEIYKREKEKNGENSSENLKLTDKRTKESKSLCCGS